VHGQLDLLEQNLGTGPTRGDDIQLDPARRGEPQGSQQFTRVSTPSAQLKICSISGVDRDDREHERVILASRRRKVPLQCRPPRS
jgi:hypothetical protein